MLRAIAHITDLTAGLSFRHLMVVWRHAALISAFQPCKSGWFELAAIAGYATRWSDAELLKG